MGFVLCWSRGIVKFWSHFLLVWCCARNYNSRLVLISLVYSSYCFVGLMPVYCARALVIILFHCGFKEYVSFSTKVLGETLVIIGLSMIAGAR